MTYLNVTTPKRWNELPNDIRTQSLHVFRLKTRVFRLKTRVFSLHLE